MPWGVAHSNVLRWLQLHKVYSNSMNDNRGLEGVMKIAKVHLQLGPAGNEK